MARRGVPGGRPPGLAQLGRLTGIRTVATAALALLTLGAVCAATAAPRKALATTTQALHQTLASAPPLSHTITASAPWSGLTNALSPGAPGGPGNQLLTGNQIGEISGQLHGDFNHGLVHLAPPAADWMSMTSPVATALTGLPGANGAPVKFEVSYRQPFSQYLRLVAGRFPPAVPPAPRFTPPRPQNGVVSGYQPYFSPLVEVVVTSPTAAKFGLRPGSKVVVAGPQPGFNGSGPITLEVTGIVAPRDPAATFWTSDAAVVAPQFEFLSPSVYYWAAGVIAGPSELAAVQQDFGPQGLAAQWLFPLSAGSPGGDQVQPLDDALTRLSAQTPPLTGDVAPMAADLTITANLLPALGAFLATEQAVDTLLWLLYVSLAVACLVVFLLTARMIALRRSADLAIRRARGASLRQIALTTALGTALICVPAAVAGAVLAVLVVPGPAPGGGWWGPAGVLVVAVCAPPAFAAWQQRLPRRRPRRSARLVIGWGRLVAEVTAIAASVAGLVVFRQQGIQPGAGVNLYTSAAPVLIAIPVVIVVLRVYPLVLRAALLGAARRSRAPAFLGLARAARTRLTPALPAFALVLALSVAAFAGMVRTAVSSGDVRASWQAAGADATITASTLHTPGATIDPAALREAEDVPGVTHAAPVWLTSWSDGFGQQFTGIVVDPAAYAALVAATQTFPRVSARLLESAPAGRPQPVLASPQAAEELGGGVTTLSPQGAVDPVPVRVAGVLPGTPALLAGGAFVILPLSAMHSDATPPTPVQFNELLLGGSGIDQARLTAVVRDMVPGGGVTFRSDILNSLTTAPLQHGTFVLFALALVVAAGFGIAVMLLELALGAAEREATLARLTVMGLGEGQRARVVVLEVLPAVVAAAVAGWACAVLLPRIVAPAVDLSVFTGSSAAVTLSPDAASIGWPLATLAVVAVAALVIEIRPARRGLLAASLRAGE